MLWNEGHLFPITAADHVTAYAFTSRQALPLSIDAIGATCKKTRCAAHLEAETFFAVCATILVVSAQESYNTKGGQQHDLRQIVI